MIRGRFGASGRPMVLGSVSLTRLGISLSTEFLVDSGADTTSLSPRDWRAAGIEARQFSAPSVTITGFGGTIECPSEPAEVVLAHDDGALDRWALQIEIAPASPPGMIIPSVLGRDILRRYRLVLSVAENVLTLDYPVSGSSR